MRSSWLFYVMFPGQIQHSALTSFLIALGEIFRRFMWNFFRMENEHMTNARLLMASKDVPLPFSLSEFRLERSMTMEAQPPLSPLSDYTRVDEERAIRELDNAEYNC